MPKPFLTYDQQIELLKSKNLIINDESLAKLYLSRIGYFTLIGGYKHPFKNLTTKKYRDDVKIEDIYALYRFDEELRHLFLNYLLIVERELKTKIAYTFCEKYGDNQSYYLQSSSYANIPSMNSEIARLILILQKLANSNSDYTYINHQRNVHKNVPLWVLINAVTFGSISKMFMFLTNSMQSQICRS